jgi:hypothetical protein
VKRSFAAVAVSLPLLGGATGALAQDSEPEDTVEPAPELPIAPTLPPDIVVRHDGTILRGYIVETVPDDYVELQLVTGVIRRLPMADVSYAGPASAAPADPIAPAPTAPVEPPREELVAPPITNLDSEARLRVLSEGPERLTLQRLTGFESGARGRYGFPVYEELCAPPCRLSLPAGEYVFGVRTRDRRRVLDAPRVFVPGGNATLVIGTQSQRGLRTLGWLTLAGTVVLGPSLFVWGVNQGSRSDDSTGSTVRDPQASAAMIAGTLLLTTGLVATPMLVLSRDSTTVRIIPGVLPTSAAASEAWSGGWAVNDRARAAPSLAGLTLVGTF